MVAKTFVDPKLAFYILKFFGCLLMHLNQLAQAVTIFTVMRDLGYHILNWSFVI